MNQAIWRWLFIRSLRSENINTVNLFPLSLDKCYQYYYQELIEHREEYITQLPTRYSRPRNRSREEKKPSEPEGILECYREIKNTNTTIWETRKWRKYLIGELSIHKKGCKNNWYNYLYFYQTLSRVYGTVFREIMEKNHMKWNSDLIMREQHI